MPLSGDNKGLLLHHLLSMLLSPLKQPVFLFECWLIFLKIILKLEDLKVLRRSPDLLNNAKIGQGQLQLIMEKKIVLPYMGVADILVK